VSSGIYKLPNADDMCQCKCEEKLETTARQAGTQKHRGVSCLHSAKQDAYAQEYDTDLNVQTQLIFPRHPIATRQRVSALCRI
jgi:hypothetical protein